VKLSNRFATPTLALMASLPMIPRSVDKGLETRDEVWILHGTLTLSMHPGIPSVAQAHRTYCVSDGSG